MASTPSSSTLSSDPSLGGKNGRMPSSPAARRLAGPSWLDLRLVAGVLLVLVSVVVGARVVSSADQSVQVWAAARDLAPGVTLQEEDVRQVPVRLFDNSSAYLRSTAEVTGQVLDRPVSAGELVPAAALREVSGRVSIALPVAAEGLPIILRRGQLVDVYASTGGQGGEGAVTELVLAAAPVQTLDGGEGGALTSSTGIRQVVVSIPSDQAGQVLAAIAGKDLSLAVLDDLSAPEGRPVPQPTTAAPTTGAATTTEPTTTEPPGNAPATTAPAPTTG